MDLPLASLVRLPLVWALEGPPGPRMLPGQGALEADAAFLRAWWTRIVPPEGISDTVHHRRPAEVGDALLPLLKTPHGHIEEVLVGMVVAVELLTPRLDLRLVCSLGIHRWCAWRHLRPEGLMRHGHVEASTLQGRIGQHGHACPELM